MSKMKTLRLSALALLCAASAPYARAGCGDGNHQFPSNNAPPEFNIPCVIAAPNETPATNFEFRFWGYQDRATANEGTIQRNFNGSGGWLRCTGSAPFLTRTSSFANWAVGNGTNGCPSLCSSGACTNEGMIFLATNTAPTEPNGNALQFSAFAVPWQAGGREFDPDFVTGTEVGNNFTTYLGTSAVPVTGAPPATGTPLQTMSLPTVLDSDPNGAVTHYLVDISFVRPQFFGPPESALPAPGRYNITAVILYYRNAAATPTDLRIAEGGWLEAGRVTRGSDPRFINNTPVDIPVPIPVSNRQYLALGLQFDCSNHASATCGDAGDLNGFVPNRVGPVSPTALAILGAPTTFAVFTAQRPISTDRRTKVQLNWVVGDNSGVQYFDMYRANGKEQPFSKINGIPLPSSATSFLDTNAPEGPNYVYEIRAMGASGQLGSARTTLQ